MYRRIIFCIVIGIVASCSSFKNDGELVGSRKVKRWF